MKITPTDIPDVLLIEPRVLGDDRGSFFEAWSEPRYREAGIPGPFLQDSVSLSRKGVLRGLHFQNPHGQGKLVSALAGEVFDVAVDLRIGSPTFRKWVGVRLSGENRLQLWIPAGFAHGFCVLSPEALFHYKCTDCYHPQSELCVLWNDPDIAVEWPSTDLILNAKDRTAPRLADIPVERLPLYAG